MSSYCTLHLHELTSVQKCSALLFFIKVKPNFSVECNYFQCSPKPGLDRPHCTTCSNILTAKRAVWQLGLGRECLCDSGFQP